MELVLFKTLLTLGFLAQVHVIEPPKPYIREKGEMHEILHFTPADILNKYE